MDSTSDAPWIDRYGYVCPIEQGKIINIDGVGEKDYYNPTICMCNGTRLLAFRLEARESSIDKPEMYHPEIAFAREIDGAWRLVDEPSPFDMLEDPIVFSAETPEGPRIVFGGVRVELLPEGFLPRTELYIGESLTTLGSQPFAIVPGMKDVRILQLPNGRFLLCRRPTGGDYHNGRIMLNVIDNLNDLSQIGSLQLPALAILDSGYATDWVGANNAYLLHDKYGVQWVGLLSHLGLAHVDGSKHYAVTTYKIKLENLIDDEVQHVMPHVIATRSCFEHGPEKTPGLGDVVFPGSLEPLGGERYRLWAGLSDARIGAIIVDDPFELKQL